MEALTSRIWSQMSVFNSYTLEATFAGADQVSLLSAYAYLHAHARTEMRVGADHLPTLFTRIPGTEMRVWWYYLHKRTFMHVQVLRPGHGCLRARTRESICQHTT
eukprot:2830523-Rhodomonas_salina.4